MHTEGDEIHVDETEASGGSKEGVVRWVLIFGTLLAIGLLSVIWITGALTEGEIEQEATVSGKIDASPSATPSVFLINSRSSAAEATVRASSAELDSACASSKTTRV